MPVFKGPNNKGNVINWKTSTGRDVSTVVATEFTSETKRTAIYLVADQRLGLGGERTLVAYQDPGKAPVLTQEGKNYDTSLQKIIVSDPKLRKTIEDQTRYHVTRGLSLFNPDGSIGSSPSSIEVNNILGIKNPPLPPGAAPPGSTPPGGPPGSTPPGGSAPAPDPQINSQFIDGSVPYGGDPVTATADPNYPLMYYPLKNRQDGTFDYLKVSAYRFLESGLRTDAQNFSVISTENRRKSKVIGTVFLPMQPGISDTNGVSWNEDSINPFQAAFGGIAASAIATFGSGKFVAGAQELFQGLIDTGQNIANNPELKNYISAYFAGQAVGTNLIARTTGTVLNNNLELLFNGPKLRSFRYSYRFTPREKPESEMIRKIIKFFKREMSTEKVGNGLFLASPNVFKLEYISKNNPNEFLNKIKFCALTDMSVNYTPDGSYMTYQDGSMTSYEVEFQFSELEPIYKNDYDTSTGSQGMGY